MKTLGLFLLLLASSACWCMPNIRIQVNNENLQSPPYLLEAIKLAESSELASGSKNPEPILSETSRLGGELFSATLDGPAESLASDEAKDEQANKTTQQDSLGQDYEPKVSVPLQGSNADSQQPKLEVTTNATGELQADKGLRWPDQNRNSQLPVTSSHLKRPVGAPSGLLDESANQGAAAAHSMVDETRAQMDDEDEAAAAARNSNQGQAKTGVSPSVIADLDETDQEAKVNLDKKPGQQLPDTLEPSQIIPEVSNSSAVPATVTRQYGTNTRTRVTLGGGYIRNKMPPLVNPSSSEYIDDKPEKPVRPLEKPKYQQKSGGGDDVDEGEKSLRDNSRIIEVPERIVLPAGVFSQNQKILGENYLQLNITTTNTAPAKPLGKLDSRCPASGTTTLEHSAACDRYFFCEDGHISEQTCPNGLMYGTRGMVRDYCVHRWDAVCGEKSIPNPISSPGCRWQWGIFSVQGSPKCTPDYYECRDGQVEVRKCSVSGQVYDDRTKSCRFAEQVGCAEEALKDFQCPPDDQGNTYWPFPRYFLNERALIHCVNDKPAIIRCRDNERVDPEHLHCVLAKTQSNQEADDSIGSRNLRERSKKEKKNNQE